MLLESICNSITASCFSMNRKEYRYTPKVMWSEALRMSIFSGQGVTLLKSKSVPELLIQILPRSEDFPIPIFPLAPKIATSRSN